MNWNREGLPLLFLKRLQHRHVLLLESDQRSLCIVLQLFCVEVEDKMILRDTERRLLLAWSYPTFLLLEFISQGFFLAEPLLEHPNTLTAFANFIGKVFHVGVEAAVCILVFLLLLVQLLLRLEKLLLALGSETLLDLQISSQELQHLRLIVRVFFGSVAVYAL